MVKQAAAILLVATAASAGAQVSTAWPQHSMDRPQPRVVDPGPFTASAPPPSDAIVLFDGRSLSGWRSADSAGGPARWRVADGYMEVVANTGAIASKASFGDVQLHVEWRTPSPPTGESQERGNSGVFLMGLYEVQVLDSYHNVTYADGHAGAIFGQFPPLVNASRPPGEWQTYDIVFHRPQFDAAGHVVAPARMTVFQNGVLVQDNVALSGPTAYQRRPPYQRHADALPIQLQDHGNPVRFRNIWARKLE
jgi:prepilin-type processing-associated H-X9-DG protein